MRDEILAMYQDDGRLQPSAIPGHEVDRMRSPDNDGEVGYHEEKLDAARAKFIERVEWDYYLE